MLSRVADSLFWMARYLERTDAILRVLKISHASSQDDIREFTWRPVLEIFGGLKEEEIRELEKNGPAVLHLFVANRNNPNSVFNMVVKARENARAAQDHISRELWQCLNDLYHRVRSDRLLHSLRAEDPETVLDGLVRETRVYTGTSETTMFLGEGLYYMNVGKYLERCLQAADVLRLRLSDLSIEPDKANDTTHWKYLLQAISGHALYLKTYRSGFEARNVVEQILFGVNFPRSLIYGVDQLMLFFERLATTSSPEGFEKVRFMMGKLRSKVQYSNMALVMERGLPDFLDEISEGLQEIGAALNQYYFAAN